MVPLQRLTHVGLCVSDLDRSLGFYRDLLGFRVRDELDAGGAPAARLLRLRGVKLRAVYLERDGVTLELLRFASPPGPAPRRRTIHDLGLPHLSFPVGDLAPTLPARRAPGAHLLRDPPREVPGTVLEYRAPARGGP